MKSVFEASTNIEAYMIKNLLHSHELESEVFGEHLQGGIGDLQAIGVIRVMVSDDNYEQAQEVIKEWESFQPPESELISENVVRKGGGFGGGVLGFVLGVALMVFLTQTNIDSNGVDYDGDGDLDRTWEYVNNIIRTENVDRNGDGDFDEIYSYDLSGNLKKSTHDNDFDDRFESVCHYRDGNTTDCRIDVDGNGFYEFREGYSRGVLNSVELYDPGSKKVKKKQYFKLGRLVKTKIDLDGDGELETLREYDEFEELVRSARN